MQNLELRGGRKKFKKKVRYRSDGHDFFPVKAEIEEKTIVEISTGNTPKLPDIQEKRTFSIDISSSKIVAI